MFESAQLELTTMGVEPMTCCMSLYRAFGKQFKTAKLDNQ